MKLSFALLAVFLGTALTSPALNLRQNEVPGCVDGYEPTGGQWTTGVITRPILLQHLLTTTTADECRASCFAKEGAEGNPNEGGVCKGVCHPFGRPTITFGFNCMGN